MAQSAKKKRAEATDPKRRFRIELSMGQLLLYVAGFVGALTWMFIFGVLIGRGLPLTSPSDTSLKGQFLRFLGLAHQPPPIAQKATEPLIPPEKIADSLTYHEELTKPPQYPDSTSTAPLNGPQQQAPVTVPPKRETAPPGKTIYTLMVSSLRSIDNAKDLVKKLRAKGYSPRLETIKMDDSGIWHRILLGSFNTRKEAQAFAARFNRQENMQGLVIQTSRSR